MKQKLTEVVCRTIFQPKFVNLSRSAAETTVLLQDVSQFGNTFVPLRSFYVDVLFGEFFKEYILASSLLMSKHRVGVACVSIDIYESSRLKFMTHDSHIFTIAFIESSCFLDSGFWIVDCK